MTTKNPSLVSETCYNGHSMVGALRRVLVCSPQAAGWDQAERAERWRELGFRHAPSFAGAQAQHEKMRRELESAGAEVIEMMPGELFSSELSGDGLTLDAVYAHDASLATDFGLILMRPGKSNRVAEARQHGLLAEKIDTPILGEIVAPGTAEAGDMVWLDAKTLLIGRGYRTNAEGIRQMSALLGSKGVTVVSAPLPHGAGSEVCLHLMSLMSLLDENTALVDLAWLAVETVELLRSLGFNFIEIDDSERDTLACNVLALGGKRLLAIEENRKTNERLGRAGFDVRTFPGAELCINGGGGPTCLTRPLLRGE
jgi:N-dimethylarginine dimethylaminohydrolase